MGHLDGKIALVTGASAGIGKQTSRILVDAGVRVICAARRLSHLESLASELGDAAIALELDVTDVDSVAKLLGRLPADWRDIDILVNNAGHDIGGRRQFHEGSAAQWAATIETNVIGLMRVTRAVLDSMVERNTGHIVNIGSVAGIQAYKACAAYAASKHAVHGLSETLRLDYGETGIKISEVLPGMVKTEFAATRFGDEKLGEEYYRDFGVCLTPEDIARSVHFVLDQPADVVIAQIVVVPTRRKPDSSVV